MNSALLLIAILIAAVGAVVVGRRYARARFLREREEVDVTVLVVDPSYTGLDIELTKRILGELGKALGLNPGVLRLNDTFDQLFGLDTWNSGHGQDVFEEWLTKEFGKLDRTEKPRTIGELVKMLQIRGDSANPISKQNADEKSQRPKEY